MRTQRSTLRRTRLGAGATKPPRQPSKHAYLTYPTAPSEEEWSLSVLLDAPCVVALCLLFFPFGNRVAQSLRPHGRKSNWKHGNNNKKIMLKVSVYHCVSMNILYSISKTRPHSQPLWTSIMYNLLYFTVFSVPFSVKTKKKRKKHLKRSSLFSTDKAAWIYEN